MVMCLIAIFRFGFLGGFAMSDQPPEDTPRWVKTMTNVPLFVGMVANEWAKLEHAMVPLVQLLLNTSQENTKIILFSMAPPQRRDLLSALAETNIGSGPIYESIKAYVREFDRLRNLRNDIVHGHWGQLTEEGEPLLRLAKSRGALKETLEQKEIKWIMQAVNDIQKLQMTTFSIIGQIRSALGPSFDKSQ